jgi:hypothetical protein
MARSEFLERINRAAAAIARGDAFFPLLLLSIVVGVIGFVLDKPSPPSLGMSSAVKTLLASLVGASSVLFAFASSYRRGYALNIEEDRIEAATQKATENPEKIQFAWVAGRATLEKYLNRNLAQVRTIATLTYVVMFAGFAFILIGLYEAFSDPAKLPVSIVASASGVLVSFVGGSFLLVYRSLLAQSREYLFVLERINGVGMAVAVIESIPEQSAELKHATTAELAKTLLTLYGASQPK